MRVAFAPEADADLARILEYIAKRSSSVGTARRFVGGIIANCRKLERFPQRGTRRDDLRPRLRTIGYRKRVTIAFRVDENVVTIVRVFYGGQDYETVLRGQE